MEGGGAIKSAAVHLGVSLMAETHKQHFMQRQLKGEVTSHKDSSALRRPPLVVIHSIGHLILHQLKSNQGEREHQHLLLNNIKKLI